MIEFLNMGGYASFVWGSYTIAALFTGVLYFRSVKALNALQATSETSSVNTKKVAGTFRKNSLV